MRVARQISRVCSRIASIDVSKSIATYFARFFTAASTWVGNLLKSSTSELYIEPTGRNCLVGDGAVGLALDQYAIYDIEKWAVQMKISDYSLQSSDCPIGERTTAGKYSIFFTGGISYFYLITNNGGSVVTNNVRADSTELVNPGLHTFTAISDGATVRYYVNGVVVDTFTPTSTKMRVNGFVKGGSASANATIGKFNDCKAKDLTSYTGDFTPEAIDALGWDHHFPLDQYKSGTSPSAVIYNCIETGTATAKLINGTVPDNLGARSDNSKSYNWNGFSNTTSTDGIDDYIDLDTIPDPNVDDIIIYGKYDVLNTGTYICGLLGNRIYIAIGNSGHWRLGWNGDITDSTVLADTDWHKFEIKAGGYLYIDDVLIQDKSAVPNSIGIIPLYIGAVNNSGSAVAHGNCSYRKVIVGNKSWNVNNEGNLVDELGVIYTNGGTGSLIPATLPVLSDGSGLDVVGLEPTNPALNNGSAHNGNEQKMRFTTVPQELIDIDVDNQFQVAGVATEWYPQDVTAAYIEKTVTANGSVTDLKIKG